MGRASSAAASTSSNSLRKVERRAERREKLIKLKELLNGDDTTATIEDVLNLYSDYASFEDGDRGTKYKMVEEMDVDSSDLDDDDLTEAELKSKVSFFTALSNAELKIGEVSERGEVTEWKEVKDWKEFLPDDTEFQRTIPELLLWQRKAAEKPKASIGRDVAYSFLDFDVKDYGNVLWKLEVPERWFPVGEDNENGTCILREHHRQVMFIALSWLYQNGVALGLTAVGIWPPGVVAAMCGSPGIGKSRSLIFLMWFLLKQKSPFLLEAGPEGRRYYSLVRPREESVRFLSDADEAKEILQLDRSVCCIVDPGQLQEGEKPKLSNLLDMKGVLGVISPCADPLHLPNGGKERTILRKFWVRPWILSLLKAVGPYFTTALSRKDNQLISQRFQDVGGIPRAIFRQAAYDTRKTIIDQSEIADDVERLYDALVHDKDEKKMVKKVPQAFMAYYSQLPFTHVQGEGNVWVDFLSQEGRNKYGMHVFEKLRSGIAKCDDYSSAGMFFERWAGSLLSSNTAAITKAFKLREFKGGSVVKEDIQLPRNGVVLRYTDEEVLLSALLQEESVKQDKPFPEKQVREAPRSTPIYNFAIDKRWYLNATLAESHPLSKAKLAKLVARVGATEDDPLNLVFFVLNERMAAAYSKRGGETYKGEVKAPGVSSEQVAKLKELVVGPYSADKLRAVAEVLQVPLKETGQKRIKTGLRLGDFSKEECDLPPGKLFKSIMEKMCLTGKNDALNMKWERLLNYVGGLEVRDLFRDLSDPSDSVKQHFVTLVPEEDRDRIAYFH